MQHLDLEAIARLVDEAPEPHEAEHLRGCLVCRRELAELRELKRRNRLLEQENEVLRRAAAYLSQANLPGK